MDSSDLFLADLVAQAPDTGEAATAGVCQELGAICTPASLSVAQTGQALELLLLGPDVLADQRDGCLHSAAMDKSTRSSGSHWRFAALGSPYPTS